MCKILYLLLYFTTYYNTVDAKPQNKRKDVFINVVVPMSEPYDTLTLYLYKNVLSERTNDYLDHNTFRAVRDEYGIFHFRVPNINNVDYIVLGKYQNFLGNRTFIPILNYYPIYPEDSIALKLEWDSTYHANDHLIPVIINYQKKMMPNIVRFPYLSYFTQYRLKFSGIGAEKYQCRYQINRANIHDVDKQTIDSLIGAFKTILDSLSWGLLKADVIGQYEESLSYYHVEKKNSPQKKAANAYFENVTSNPEIPQKAKLLSLFYPEALIQRACVKYSRHSYDSVISYLANNYKGEIRDKLLTIYSMQNRLPDSALLVALNIVQAPYCNRILKDFITNQMIGTKAYNFCLPDRTGKMVRLSDFQGKVVLLDFWFTGCHVCSMVYQDALSYIEDMYKGNDEIVFISISIDRNEAKWLKSLQRNLYTSLDAVNLYTGGHGNNHPVIEKYSVNGYPAIYLIDKHGKIKARNVSQKTRIIQLIEKELRLE